MIPVTRATFCEREREGIGYKPATMPQNPYAVRKKRARRIKKLMKWRDKQTAAAPKADEPKK
jgi:hypothetical protein